MECRTKRSANSHRRPMVRRDVKGNGIVIECPSSTTAVSAHGVAMESGHVPSARVPMECIVPPLDCPPLIRRSLSIWQPTLISQRGADCDLTLFQWTLLMLSREYLPTTQTVK